MHLPLHASASTILREEFRLNPKPVQAAMGESAILECVPPKGHPEPTVRWRKDGEYVNTNKGRFRIVSPGNLVISDVRQSDEGHYRCVAENMAGFRESVPATMTVHVKPFFVREPEHVTVLADEDVQFECKVGGDPLPTITWRRQDGKMPSEVAQHSAPSYKEGHRHADYNLRDQLRANDRILPTKSMEATNGIGYNDFWLVHIHG
ncbi:roundabout homolog 1 [Caerostris extrusa]|uniref:Roundabout homolog 1 n=1 Tax=Caerostris extrusa TaxID=172846 RepID=A0AAV4T3V7_CAEEX|nr:roundabout homolog 1 [Caerostris extrusa]